MQNQVHRSGTQPEIIAVVLPDGTPDTPAALRDFVATGTMLLVRHADGRVALEPACRNSAWLTQAAAEDSVGRLKAIVDPLSREVVGYEMETVELSIAS